MAILNSIDWVLPKGEIHTPVWASIKLIEERWRHVESDYITPGGGGRSIGNRYERVGEWVRSKGRLWTPVMCLDEADNPSFTDGRHRFAWVRDHQVKVLRIVVPSEQSDDFFRLYGSTAESSNWRE
jgi:hypothetical protein